MRFSPDKKKLNVLCLKVDTIDGLSINPYADELNTPPTQPTTSNNHHGDLGGFKDALWRTFLCNRNFDGTMLQPVGRDLRALLDFPLPQVNGHLSILLEKVFYNFIVCNRDLRLAGQPLDHYFAHKGLHCKIDIERRIIQDFLGEPLLKAAYHVLDNRLFTTHKGLVGRAPLSSQPGDLVCVLAGCWVPLILRPQGESFKVIGACYAHGVMEGEAIEMLFKGNVKLEGIELC
jgi:hypothetical protein